MTEPEVTEPAAPAATEVTINFSNYEDGAAQYVEETRTLHDMISLHITECDLKTTLRIYQDASYDGKAEFIFTSALKSFTVNAGNKDSGLEVYASVDGVDWVLIETLNVVSAYADYTVEMPEGTAYKYLKLDSVNGQIRIPNMKFIFG